MIWFSEGKKTEKCHLTNILVYGLMTIVFLTPCGASTEEAQALLCFY